MIKVLTVARTATIGFDGAHATTLSYYRRWQLSASMGEASFAVTVNDGVDRVVDDENAEVAPDPGKPKGPATGTIGAAQADLVPQEPAAG